MDTLHKEEKRFNPTVSKSVVLKRFSQLGIFGLILFSGLLLFASDADNAVTLQQDTSVSTTTTAVEKLPSLIMMKKIASEPEKETSPETADSTTTTNPEPDNNLDKEENIIAEKMPELDPKFELIGVELQNIPGQFLYPDLTYLFAGGNKKSVQRKVQVASNSFDLELKLECMIQRDINFQVSLDGKVVLEGSAPCEEITVVRFSGLENEVGYTVTAEYLENPIFNESVTPKA